MESEETQKLAKETAKEVIKVAEVKAVELLEKDAQTRVTYEDWYNQQLQNKDRFDHLHKQLQSIQDNQPKIMEELLQKYVNGKIDTVKVEQREMAANLKEYIKDDMEHKRWRDEEEKKWKDRFEPYIEGLVNVSKGSKIIVYIIVTIASFFGALLAIKSFFK